MTTTPAKLAARRRIDELLELEAAALAERFMVLLERLDVIHADDRVPDFRVPDRPDPAGRQDSDR